MKYKLIMILLATLNFTTFSMDRQTLGAGGGEIKNIEDLNRKLMKAVREGQTETVEALLAAGAKVKKVNDGALLEAATSGHIEIVKTLLDAGAKANKRALNSKLLEAAQKNNLKIAASLLQAHANVDTVDDYYKQTALMIAASQGHTEMVNLLLEEFADTQIRDKDGNTAIMHASNPEILDILLNQEININATNWNGNTALMIAANKGNVAMVDALLSSGAKNIDQKILDHMFIRDAGLDINKINVLLKLGANVDVTNEFGATKLTSAAENNKTEIVRMLLNAKANINHRDRNDYTPLTKSALHGRINIPTIKFLLQENAEIQENMYTYDREIQRILTEEIKVREDEQDRKKNLLVKAATKSEKYKSAAACVDEVTEDKKAE